MLHSVFAAAKFLELLGDGLIQVENPPKRAREKLAPYRDNDDE